MARQGRRPLSLFILVALILLLAAAAVVIIFGERRLEGSIPGDAPVLSLAATPKGFFVGTSDGLFISGDGRRWQRHSQLEKGPVAVTTQPFSPEPPSTLIPPLGLAGSDRDLFLLIEPDVAHQSLTAPEPVGSLAVLPLGILVGGRGANIFLITGGGFPRLGSGGPSQTQALAGSGEEVAFVYTAGIDSGIWRATGSLTTEEIEWRQLLETPATAVLVDPKNDHRILIGTAGGILVSGNHGESWQFTTFRGSVSGLSQRNGEFFAVSDRLIYRSPDGEKDWTALAFSRPTRG